MPDAARRSAAFLALAFGISWSVVGVGWLAGGADNRLAAFVTLTAMMTGPAIAAVACAFAFEPAGQRLAALGLRWTPNRWWPAAWAVAVALCGASVALTLLLGGRSWVDPAQGVIDTAARMGADTGPLHIPGLGALIVVQALILGPLINAPALTFTEELGWRGYLHHVWRPMGFWPASLATGAVWGVWHAPAILLFGHNYPDNRGVGAVLFVLFCTLTAPMLTLVRDRGRSVVAAGILHGTLNAVAGLTLIVVSDPVFPWNGMVGIGGYLALALGVAGVAALRPTRAAP
ncbi:MAG: CPBP family intramembrane glutamic endopeptidase [Myxococcota bacterium]